MKKNSKDKSLAKKVLLSVVAAGVMSGFVLSAEAADSTLDVSGEKVTKENVQVAKVAATGGAELTLKNGTVSGLKENRSDPDDPADEGMIDADVATEIGDKGTVLHATDVVFIGEVAAVEGSKIVINGGSVTAGNCYYDDAHGNKIEKLGTEIGAHDGSEIELNKVEINSNLGAFDGSVITVNDSNVHAAYAIYAEGKGTTINLNSSDGKAEYTVDSDYGIEANEGAYINIKGGKVSTTYFVAIENSKITVNNAAINASNGILADNSEITLDGEEKTTYTVGEGFVAENGGKIYINGGTLQENNLKSKMYNVKVEEGLSNTDAKGIVLDKNGVISTMSDQIYANKASETQKESGAITNEGIDFKGGKLVLNDAKYTLSYSQSW